MRVTIRGPAVRTNEPGRDVGAWRPQLASKTSQGKKLLGWALLLLGLLVFTGVDKILEAFALGILPEWVLSL